MEVVRSGLTSDIGDLWKLVLVVILGAAFFIVVFKYSDQASRILKRVTRIKAPIIGGEVELEPERGQSAQDGGGTTPSVAQSEIAPDETPQKSLETAESDSKDSLAEMFDAFENKDFKVGEEVYERLLASEADEKDRLGTQAIYCYLRYVNAGDSAAMEELQEMATNPKATHIAQLWIGISHNATGAHDQAAIAYRLAADSTGDPSERAGDIVSRAKALDRGGRSDEARVLLHEEISSASDSDALFHLFMGLGEIYGDGEQLMRAVAYERACEYRPNNQDARFKVAYAYSELELHHLALHHYRVLLRLDSDQVAARNNLGVSYSRLGLRIRANKEYRTAMEGGNTLGAANLASGYIEAGLPEDAQQLLDSSRRKDDVHVDISKRQTWLSKQQADEDEKNSSVSTVAGEGQRFFADWASGFFGQKAETVNLSGRWQTADGTNVEISDASGTVEATWKGGKGWRRFVGKSRNGHARVTWYEEKSSFLRLVETDTPPEYEEHGHVLLAPQGGEPTLLVALWHQNEFAVERSSLNPA